MAGAEVAGYFLGEDHKGVARRASAAARRRHDRRPRPGEQQAAADEEQGSAGELFAGSELWGSLSESKTRRGGPTTSGE